MNKKTDFYANMTIEQLKAELKTFEDATKDPSFTKALRSHAEKQSRIIRVKLISALKNEINKAGEQ